MPHSNREILLGSDSATFWTGTTWGDDPAQAQVFDSPREAWRAAVDLATAEQAYLDGTAVSLYVRDHETGELTIATTTDFRHLRPALRSHWKAHFGAPLPPNLPHPATDSRILVQRMREYLEDTDWNAVRRRGGDDPGLGLDPAFSIACNGSVGTTQAQRGPYGKPTPPRTSRCPTSAIPGWVPNRAYMCSNRTNRLRPVPSVPTEPRGRRVCRGMRSSVIATGSRR
jgi:hypothetical protein